MRVNLRLSDDDAAKLMKLIELAEVDLDTYTEERIAAGLDVEPATAQSVIRDLIRNADTEPEARY